MNNFFIGQEFYYVPNRRGMRGRGYTVTIYKIGRKWVYAGDIRFDKELGVDGGDYSAGSLYESKEVYDAVVENSRLWSEFRSVINSRNRPAKNSAAAIRKTCEILGIEIDPNTLKMTWN